MLGCEVAAERSDSLLVMQIRVMPSCWYILQRFFLRIDGHMVRIRDVRTLCDMSPAKPVLRKEISHMEASFDELSASGIAQTPVSHASSELHKGMYCSNVSCKSLIIMAGFEAHSSYLTS